MDNITLGQIAVAVAFVVALIGGVKSLKKVVKDGIEAAMKDKLDTIEKKIDGIEKSNKEVLKRLDDVDLENCKNYLITFLSETARGEMKDETEIQRFWEEYEHYVSKGGNSYIKHKVDDLKGKGLI